MKTKEQRLDIYERITNQIVKAIEQGADKWELPRHRSQTIPMNAATRKSYRGVNVLALWATAAEKGYQSEIWATYAQWQELGAQVRKGEKSAFIVFWKFRDQADEKEERQDEEEQTMRLGPIARGYNVFNADQVDGFTLPEVPKLPAAKRIEVADNFISVLDPDVRYGGNRAFYNSTGDYIQMPQFQVFKGATAFYSTLAHELIHWTGAKHRLDRDLQNRFGSEAYAAEELIAELGAAFLSADLGLCNEPRPDHAAYVQTWLKVLRNDSRAIFTAASKAQTALDWLHASSPASTNLNSGAELAA